MAAPGGVEPLFQVSELYDAGYDALVTPALCGAHKFSAVAVVASFANAHTAHTHTTPDVDSVLGGAYAQNLVCRG